VTKAAAILTALLWPGCQCAVPGHRNADNAALRSYLNSAANMRTVGEPAALEIVLARYEEDVSWLEDEYKPFVTIYNKGSPISVEGSGDLRAIGRIKSLPNVGREGHTYLWHVVNNYNNLADWTVFSQAERPSTGYGITNDDMGHLLSGVSFSDYILEGRSGRRNAFFMFSTAMNLTSLAHSFRTPFTSQDFEVERPLQQCARGSLQGDAWGEWEDASILSAYLKDTQLEQQGTLTTPKEYWEKFVRGVVPDRGVVYYAQGARFSLSRELIHQKPIHYYAALLEELSHHVDPYQNYFNEWFWYYIFGHNDSGDSVCPDGNFENSNFEPFEDVQRARQLQNRPPGSGFSLPSFSMPPPTPSPTFVCPDSANLAASCEIELGTTNVLLQALSGGSDPATFEFCQVCGGGMDECSYSAGNVLGDRGQYADVLFDNLEQNVCCMYGVRASFRNHPECEVTEAIECCSGSTNWVDMGMEIRDLTVEEYEASIELQEEMADVISATAQLPYERYTLASAEDLVDARGNHVAAFLTHRVFASSEEESDVVVKNFAEEDFSELTTYLQETIESGIDLNVEYVEKNSVTPNPTTFCPDEDISLMCGAVSASSVTVDMTANFQRGRNVTYSVCQMCEDSTTCLRQDEVVYFSLGNAMATFENLESSSCCIYSIVAMLDDSDCDESVEYVECCTNDPPQSCSFDIDCWEGVCIEHICVTDAPTAFPSASPSSSPTATAVPCAFDIDCLEGTCVSNVCVTTAPTLFPSASPTFSPTKMPCNFDIDCLEGICGEDSVCVTDAPTESPSVAPTPSPSLVPTTSPTRTSCRFDIDCLVGVCGEDHLCETAAPTALPSAMPSASPTAVPTSSPTQRPCQFDVDCLNGVCGVDNVCITFAPTSFPTPIPTSPTLSPTKVECYFDVDCLEGVCVSNTCMTAFPTYDPTPSPTPVPCTDSIPSCKVFIDIYGHEVFCTTNPSAHRCKRSCGVCTLSPTESPTVAPSATPTISPTLSPTLVPTHSPTQNPTLAPTAISCVDGFLNNNETGIDCGGPCRGCGIGQTCNIDRDCLEGICQDAVCAFEPTHVPTASPTAEPSFSPSSIPSKSPSNFPTALPSFSPTATPCQFDIDCLHGICGEDNMCVTIAPTEFPTNFPTKIETVLPTRMPTTMPSESPSPIPTSASCTDGIVNNGESDTDCGGEHCQGCPLGGTCRTTADCKNSECDGSVCISFSPTAVPTPRPSALPTSSPTAQPSISPTADPTSRPSPLPTFAPSDVPTANPTHQPTLAPSESPTAASCLDGIRNNDETDVDCGGLCPGCQLGAACLTGADCLNGDCQLTFASSMFEGVCVSFSPTFTPSVSPSFSPTRAPTFSPTMIPTPLPTNIPSLAPSTKPTFIPTKSPSLEPTGLPTEFPSSSPTGTPTGSPSVSPSLEPTSRPSSMPSEVPTTMPTKRPTASPSEVPTLSPSQTPTDLPTITPTAIPSTVPTAKPSPVPTVTPTAAPTLIPTISPTAPDCVDGQLNGDETDVDCGGSCHPCAVGQACLTDKDCRQSNCGDSNVCITFSPTFNPTFIPTFVPTDAPSPVPSLSPSTGPTAIPTVRPSSVPTLVPSPLPTALPSALPTLAPTARPTEVPTLLPTGSPTLLPTLSPTKASCIDEILNGNETDLDCGGDCHPCDVGQHCLVDTDCKDSECTSNVCTTFAPTPTPTTSPSFLPTMSPSASPSESPSAIPTTSPTFDPTFSPTEYPTTFPTISPTTAPSASPSREPSSFPSSLPTETPTGAPCPAELDLVLSCGIVLGTSDVTVTKEEASPSSIQIVLEFCQQCFGSSEGIDGGEFDFDSCEYSPVDGKEVTYSNTNPNQCCLYAARATYPLHPDCEQIEVVECCSGGDSWIQAEVQISGITLDDYESNDGIEDALIQSIAETSSVDPSAVHITSVQVIDAVDVDGRRSLLQAGIAVLVTFVVFLQGPEQQNIAVADAIADGWTFEILGEYVSENVNSEANVRQVDVVDIVVPTAIPTASPTADSTEIPTIAPTSNFSTSQPTFSPTIESGELSGENFEATSGSFLQSDNFPILIATVLLIVCGGVYKWRKDRRREIRKVNAEIQKSRLKKSLRNSEGDNATDDKDQGEDRARRRQDSPGQILLDVYTPKGDEDVGNSDQQNRNLKTEEPPPAEVCVDTEDPSFSQENDKARGEMCTDVAQDTDKTRNKEHVDVEDGKRVTLPHMEIPRDHLPPTAETGHAGPEEGKGVNYCEPIFHVDAPEKKKKKKKKKKGDSNTLMEGDGDEISPEKKKKSKREKKSKKVKPQHQDARNSENMGISGTEDGPQAEVQDRSFNGSSSVAVDGFADAASEPLEKQRGKVLESVSVDRNPLAVHSGEEKKKEKKKKKKKKDPLSTERTPKNDHKKKKKKKVAYTVPGVDSEEGGYQPPPDSQPPSSSKTVE